MFRALGVLALVSVLGCSTAKVDGGSGAGSGSAGTGSTGATGTTASSSSGGTGSTASSSSGGTTGAQGSSTGSSGASTGSSGSSTGSVDAGPLLILGVVEEQPAVCFQGEGYPCASVNAESAQRADIAQLAPGLAVRFGGFETENSGFGYPGNAVRRQANLFLDAGQEDPDWLIGRAQLAGYGGFILSVPVTTSKSSLDGGAHTWTAADATSALDAWQDVLNRTGFPPPAFIELGNEPWLHASGPDGDKGDVAAYVAQAGLIGQAVRAKIQQLGWPTRIAVVADNWPGTHFEQSGHVLDFPQETIALARQLAINGAPVLQTHGYPNNGGYWCPLPETQSDHSDVACVYAFYTALRALKAAAPDADLIVTEDNYNSSAWPAGGVHTTLAALLTYAAGGVAYTHYANNWQGSTGQRYELFDQGAPMPLLQTDLPRLQSFIAGLHVGELQVTASGQVHVPSSGYGAIVNAQSAPAPYQQGDAPTHYVFTAGNRTLTVDVSALTITASP